MPEEIGCVALAGSGGFVAGLRSALWRLDTAARPVGRRTVNPEGSATARFTDGRVDPAGRLLLGTIDEPKSRGTAMDAEGCYWTGLFEGGRGQRYAPDGRLPAEYPVPVRCLTKVASGGADPRTPSVTTARTGGPDADLARLPLSARSSRRAPRAGPPRTALRRGGIGMTARHPELESTAGFFTDGAEIMRAHAAQGANVASSISPRRRATRWRKRPARTSSIAT